MNKAIMLAAVTFSSALAGCERAGETANASRPDAAAAESEVRAAEARGLAAWQARNLDGIMALYAPDAMVKVTPAAAWVGTDAIRTGVTPFVQDANFQIQLSPDEVRVGSDLASTRGSYTVRYTNPATRQPTTETGTYVTVWQRQADGSWKAVEDIASATLPAPPAPQ